MKLIAQLHDLDQRLSNLSLWWSKIMRPINITVEELSDLLANKKSTVQLVDVREPWEHSFCKIEGSLLIPMNLLNPSDQRFDKDKMIVFICHHGIRSYQIANYLISQGFGQVANLVGGIDEWSKVIDDTVPRY
jgi:rhodanese-related sulfurtransferase